MAFPFVYSLLINKREKDVSTAIVKRERERGGGDDGVRLGVGCCRQINNLSANETFVGESFFPKTANYHSKSRDILKR